ncbi:MAG: hypothetical protein AB7J28_16110 [Hyphomonadaceae bacterium]
MSEADKGGGLPGWLVVLAAAGIAVVAALGLFFLMSVFPILPDIRAGSQQATPREQQQSSLAEPRAERAEAPAPEPQPAPTEAPRADDREALAREQQFAALHLARGGDPAPAPPRPVEVRPSAACRAEPITDPPWISRASASDIAREYPAGARAEGRGGRASLSCTVQRGGRLSCGVSNEAPGGYGFGAAALAVAERNYRMGSASGGCPTEGRRVSISINFAG